MKTNFPELPKPASVSLIVTGPGLRELCEHYTSEQMRDYVEADRAKRQAEQERLDLTELSELAKLYCINYASPHHITFNVQGLRYLVEAAPPPAQVPEGWRLVPLEPTDAMLQAAGHVNSEWLNDMAPVGESRYAAPMREVYKALLAAAPNQPQ